MGKINVLYVIDSFFKFSVLNLNKRYVTFLGIFLQLATESVHRIESSSILSSKNFSKCVLLILPYIYLLLICIKWSTFKPLSVISYFPRLFWYGITHPKAMSSLIIWFVLSFEKWAISAISCWDNGTKKSSLTLTRFSCISLSNLYLSFAKNSKLYSMVNTLRSLQYLPSYNIYNIVVWIIQLQKCIKTK